MAATQAILLLGLLLPGDEPAQHHVKEKVTANSQVKNRVHLVVRGAIKVEGKDQQLAGQALLEYPEKVLDVGKDGMASKVIRYYEDARAKFVVNNHEDPRQIRVPVRLIAGEDTGTHLEVYSPSGPLTGDERELIEDVLDTTRIPALLPPLPVAVGASFDPEPAILCRLCQIHHYISSTVKGKLDSHDGQTAKLTYSGKVHGISNGVEIKSSVEAKLTYDVASGMVTNVEWSQKDNRGPSPIGPPGEFDVKISVTRSKTDSRYLAADAVAAASKNTGELARRLLFTDPAGRFRFLHDRSWHLTMLNEQRAVLRKMKDGEFVCQLNVTILEPNAERAKMTPDELQAMVERVGGWKIEEVVRADSVVANGPYDLQLLVANGTSGNLRLSQRHYLATMQGGRQLIFSFLVEPKNDEKLGTEDLAVVNSLEFLSRAASKPGNETK